MTAKTNLKGIEKTQVKTLYVRFHFVKLFEAFEVCFLGLP